MTLTDFLLQRIAEDEAGATLALGGSVSWPTRALSAAERAAVHRAAERAAPDPARVLAECAAKRRIVERFRWVDLHTHTTVDDDYEIARETLCDLALPYADHPDYREEWR